MLETLLETLYLLRCTVADSTATRCPAGTPAPPLCPPAVAPCCYHHYPRHAPAEQHGGAIWHAGVHVPRRVHHTRPLRGSIQPGQGHGEK